MATAAVLLVAGLLLYELVRESLIAEFDESLVDKAKTLSSLIEEEQARIELEFAEADMAEFSRLDRPQYFQVRDTDGNTIARSPSLGAQDLPFVQAQVARHTISDLVLPNGEPGRMASVRCTARQEDDIATTADGIPILFGLARDVRNVTHTLAKLRIALWTVGVLAVAVSVAVLSVVVRVGLMPANILANDIDTIDERNLSTRLDQSGTPVELQPIISKLNKLLRRLGDAFDREKAMTASIAHELRTPLAGIRTTLEVAKSRERKAEEYGSAIDNCLAMCVQTQDLIESLLALFRLDAGLETLESEQVNISAMLESTWALYETSARAKGLTMDWDVTPDIFCESDPDKLSIVFDNLLGNATSHADEGGNVSIHAYLENGRPHVHITNSACRLSKADIDKVFDRFWRGDQSRQKDQGHCGLGLSICKTIVLQLSGSISATLTADSVFLVHIVL